MPSRLTLLQLDTLRKNSSSRRMLTRDEICHLPTTDTSHLLMCSRGVGWIAFVTRLLPIVGLPPDCAVQVT